MRLIKPTWKQKAMIVIILLSLISFVVVSTTDNGALHKTKSVRDKYDSVFKNIPKLFQHFIEVLNEKPEVLERNDVTVFKRDVSTSYKSNDNINNEEVTYLKDTNEDDRYDEGYLTTKTFETDTDEFQVDISDDFYEYLGDPGVENKADDSGTTSRSEEFEDDMYLGELSLNSFKLTPEEISSNAVKVEQMLEDYNSSR